jgi:DNA repair exonuclease SbcCD ATPase subunit
MIESIRLKNFRKHKDLALQLDSKFNLLHGRNNSGKTTIFYAIEYCLFGNVGGFKKIAQLAGFKENIVGVELIFKGKDGEKYKLQRMHRLKGKSRSAEGNFTLKKMMEDKEKYILASDFGNREEELSLKLLEILGISKRFFETGVHFAQGDISNILKGDEKLDIVFGIKTATALSNIFRHRALEFEKEVKMLDTFEELISQARTEKKEYHDKLDTKHNKQITLESEIKNQKSILDQLENFKEYSEKISENVKSLEKTEKVVKESDIKIELINKDLEELETKFETFEAFKKDLIEQKDMVNQFNETIKNREKESSNLQEEINRAENKKVELKTLKNQRDGFLEDLDSLIKDFGSKEKLKEKIKDFEDENGEIKKKLSLMENKLTEIQNFFRTIERKRGNIKGILERRKSNKNNQKCEYCGSPIDSEKIKSEILDCKSKLKEITKEIGENEQKKDSLVNNIEYIREEEKTCYQEILRLKNTLKKVNETEEKAASLSEKDLGKEIKNLEQKINKLAKELDEKNEDLKKLKEDLENSTKKLAELDSINKQYKKQKEKLKIIEEQRSKQQKQYADLNEKFLTLLGTTGNKLEKYSSLLEKEDPFSQSLKKLIDQIQIFKVEKTLNSAKKLQNHFNELIISKLSEISSNLKHLEDQRLQIIDDLEEIKEQIKRLDRNIANNEKKVSILKIKKDLSEKYRNFQEIFKETQQIIRDGVSTALEEKILEYQQLLSPEDEFEKIHIDNEDYSLSITPKGIDITESFPAWVYEGGGYKLLLGLSYKFSLSELISQAPFLLIDEPTEFIDAYTRESLLSNICNIAEKTQVLLITHQDVDKIVCDNRIELKK